MCGIACILNISEQTSELRKKALKMSQKIRHRGPDWSGIYVGGSAILAHERLSIVDPESGQQPLFSPDKKMVLAVNGEIYNHREIRKWYEGRYEFQTGSDCEVILALYRDWKRMGTDDPTWIFEKLNGIFAFCLYDEEDDSYLIGRDPIGVIPLYIGADSDGKTYVGSELKALEGFCDTYEPFLPGHYYTSKHKKLEKWRGNRVHHRPRHLRALDGVHLRADHLRAILVGAEQLQALAGAVGALVILARQVLHRQQLRVHLRQRLIVQKVNVRLGEDDALRALKRRLRNALHVVALEDAHALNRLRAQHLAQLAAQLLRGDVIARTLLCIDSSDLTHDNPPP